MVVVVGGNLFRSNAAGYWAPHQLPIWIKATFFPLHCSELQIELFCFGSFSEDFEVSEFRCYTWKQSIGNDRIIFRLKVHLWLTWELPEINRLN